MCVCVQRTCKVCHDCIGNSHVSLAVLKVDRVHLVRHRARTNLAILELLSKVSVHDISPHVAIKVEKDRVESHDGVEQLRDVVVRLNLRHNAVPVKLEAFGDKRLVHRLPVSVGIRRKVRVVVSHGSGKFSTQRHRLSLRELAAEAIGKHRELLS